MKRVLIVAEPSRIPKPSWVGLVAVGVDGETQRLIERPSQYDENRLALHGAAAALSRFRHEDLDIVLEDGNLVRAAGKWLPDWAAHHWTVSTGRSVRNEDAWRLIWSLLPGRQVAWAHGRKDPAMRDAREWLKGVVSGKPAAAKTAVRPTEPVETAPAPEAPISRPVTEPATAKEASKVVRDITITIAAQAANPAVNAGPVGFGAVLRSDVGTIAVPGKAKATSLPRMLAEGTLESLRRLQRRLGDEKVTLKVFAPQYVISCLRNSKTWAAQGWKKTNGFPVRHADVWEQTLGITDAIADSMALVIDERAAGIDADRDAAMHIASEQLAMLTSKGQ